MHLALSAPSLRRKRHESAMSIVMGSGPNAAPQMSQNALGRKPIFSRLSGDFGGKKVGTPIWAIVVRFPK